MFSYLIGSFEKMGFRTTKDEWSPSWDHRNSNFDNGGLEPMRFIDDFAAMVQKERDFMPQDDYLQRLRIVDLELSCRSRALDWILKANAHFNFGTACACLSVNYFDRYLSVHIIPFTQSWIFQLLAVACFSIAAKIEEVNVPRCVDVQVGDPEFVFDYKTIHRMELLVLGSLKWRMQAITPYSFIEHFISKIGVDQSSLELLLSKSKQLILNTIKGIDLLEFRPSEIAAAVTIYVSSEDLQSLGIDKAMSSFIHVEKGKVLKCLELMIDLSLNSVCGASMDQSLAGVLDAVFLISKSNALADGS